MRWITASCVALIMALWAVGIVASQPVRHLVQTAPIWIGVVLGARKMSIGKWAALPFFVIWLCLMTLIWLYLLGWAQIITGKFSPIEITLTLIIGAVSAIGIVGCFKFKAPTVGWGAAIAVLVTSAVLQLAAVRASMLPWIARH
jgi:hypothetical protein